MSSLFTDTHLFLCVELPQQEGKVFSIQAAGQLWSNHDHKMLVVHKKQVRTISWKDLGDTMQLIRLVPNVIGTINDNTDLSKDYLESMYRVLNRYRGYDEEHDVSYSYLPRLSGKKLEESLLRFTTFTQQDDIKIINLQNGHLQLSFAENSGELSNEHILAELLALYLLYGNKTVVHHELRAIKIQIPALEHHIVEKLDQLVAKLRNSYFVINSTYSKESQTTTLSSSDPDLLSYILILEQGQGLHITNKILEIKQEILTSYSLPDSLHEYRRKLYEVKR